MGDVSVSSNRDITAPPVDPDSAGADTPPPSEQLINATGENDFDAAIQVLTRYPEQRETLLASLSQSDPGAYYRLTNTEGDTNTATPSQAATIASAAEQDSWQRSVAKALDALNPVGKLQDFLQPQLAKLTRSAGLGNTEWGASLQKVLDTPGTAAAFRQGITEGLIRGAEDTVVGIASMAGKVVQYGADTSVLGKGGDALRGLTGKLPGWLDAAVPSAKRGEESDAAIRAVGSNIAGYVSSRAQDPSLFSSDVKNAIGGMWNSIKGDHAKAAAQGPEAEARWWGNIVGRVTFEVAATVVPVAGQAGKVDKAADATRLLTKVDDVSNIARGTIAVGDDARLLAGTSAEARAAVKVSEDVATRNLEMAGSINRVELARSANLAKTGTLDELLKLPRGSSIPGREGIILTQKSVKFADIYKLSVKEGIEFSLTKENGKFVLRSGSPDSVAVPRGVRPIAHTHPPDDVLGVQKLPSRADINLLNYLWSQNPNGPRPFSFVIWGTEPGQTTRFGATGLHDLPPPPKGR
jgi:hypothetical protein